MVKKMLNFLYFIPKSPSWLTTFFPPSLIIYNISFFSLEITPCSILQPTYNNIVIVLC